MTNTPSFPCRDSRATEAETRTLLRAMGFDVFVPRDPCAPARLVQARAVYRGANICVFGGPRLCQGARSPLAIPDLLP